MKHIYLKNNPAKFHRDQIWNEDRLLKSVGSKQSSDGGRHEDMRRRIALAWSCIISRVVERSIPVWRPKYKSWFTKLSSCQSWHMPVRPGNYLPPTEETRSSATAEGQRVSYTRLSRLTHWSCTSLTTASVLQLYNRLAKLVSTLSAKKPCDIRTF